MKKEYIMSVLFLVVIVLGSLLGVFLPDLGIFLSGYTDYLLLTLIFLIFFEIPFENLFINVENFKVLTLMWVTNFVLIPIIGFLIASLFFSGTSLVMLGVMIYFIAPCTDWFLGFTKVARGNICLGSILIPINMISQIILYPIFIFIFMGSRIELDIVSMFSILVNWFFIPFVLAIILHFLLKELLSEEVFSKSSLLVEIFISFLLILVIFSLFIVNVSVILENIIILPLIIVSVFLFFLIIFFIVEVLSKFLKLSYENFVLFSMTTSARNAPLMLGITMSVFPNEPLIYSALIIGMLVEFPHLSILSGILLKKKEKYKI